MANYDVKKIEFKLKKGGATMTSAYCGSLGFNRPKSEYEAKKMAEEWLSKRYPGYEIVDLKIDFK